MRCSWQDKEVLAGTEQRNHDNKLTFQENRSQQLLLWELMSNTLMSTNDIIFMI